MQKLTYILLFLGLGFLQAHGQSTEKEEALIQAIQQQDYKMVKSWIKLGADPNMTVLSSDKAYTFFLSREALTLGPAAKKQEVYLTAVHVAAYVGDEKILKYLLKKGGNKDAQDSQGKTPLMYALQRPGSEGAGLLLMKKGANYFAQDQNGNTALHYAALGGNPEGIHMMHGGGLQANQRNLDGMTPALAAAMSPSVQTLDQIAYVGGDLQATDSIGMNALHFAAAGGHIEVIEHLLNNGFEANGLSTNLFSPLDLAKLNGQADAMGYLLSKGSKLSNFLFEPLYQAVKEQDLFEVDRLLREGANPNRKADPPITHMAARQKSVGILNLILQNGADPNVISESTGLTAVEEAYLADRAGNLLVLLKNGAEAGDSLLSRGILEMGKGDPTGQWEEMVNLLLERRLKHPDQILKTEKVAPLHAAVWTGNKALVRTLLREGADPDHLSGHGFAPIHYLAVPFNGKQVPESTASQILEMLKGAGANLQLKTGATLTEVEGKAYPGDASLYDLAQAANHPGLVVLSENLGIESKMSAKFHQIYAKRLSQLGQEERALYYCNQALAQDSENGPALDLKGRILFLQKDFSGALKVLNQERPNYPKDAEALYIRGFCNYQVKKYKEARKDLERSISYDPENPQSWLMLGKSFYYLRDKVEACKAWKKSRELGLEGAQQYIDAHCK